jgi:hypothetical protein
MKFLKFKNFEKYIYILKEIAEGFENPIHSFLNTKLSSAQANLLVQFDNQPIMDIYESILDFNSSQQTTKVLETLKLEKSVFKLVNTGYTFRFVVELKIVIEYCDCQ